MNTHAIEATKINIGFNGVQILYDVDFSVRRGEIHALVGTNGAGKSTLVKIINGVYRKDSGSIKIFGKPAEYDTPDGAQKIGIAMVFQDLSLIPTMTVAENIFLKSHPYRKGFLINDRMNECKALELLTKIGVDTEISPHASVASMSIGQQQIVEIAKALSSDPKILILDEPTASLSSTEIDRLFTVLNTLKKQGITIIYITHYLQDIFKICDGVTLIRDGRILFSKQTAEIDLPYLVGAMTNNSVGAIAWNRTHTRTGIPLLEACSISTRHIHDVSLSIHPGEVVGVAGLLGSGRTELMRALFGIDRITKGTVRIQGQPVKLTSSASAIEHGIALVPENRRLQGLVLDDTVSENVILAIVNRLRKLFWIDEDKKNSLVSRYIKLLGVKTQGPNQKVRYLSGGNQQKIVVAKFLASESKVLLLDDPTFGVDLQAKHEIMKIIDDYVAKGNGVLLVSSEFNEISAFCDVVYIMKKGRLTELISNQVSEDDLLIQVQ